MLWLFARILCPKTKTVFSINFRGLHCDRFLSFSDFLRCFANNRSGLSRSLILRVEFLEDFSKILRIKFFACDVFSFSTGQEIKYKIDLLNYFSTILIKFGRHLDKFLHFLNFFLGFLLKYLQLRFQMVRIR